MSAAVIWECEGCGARCFTDVHKADLYASLRQARLEGGVPPNGWVVRDGVHLLVACGKACAEKTMGETLATLLSRTGVVGGAFALPPPEPASWWQRLFDRLLFGRRREALRKSATAYRGDLVQVDTE